MGVLGHDWLNRGNIPVCVNPSIHHPTKKKKSRSTPRPGIYIYSCITYSMATNHQPNHWQQLTQSTNQNHRGKKCSQDVLYYPRIYRRTGSCPVGVGVVYYAQ